MKRTVLTGILGIGLLIGSLFLSGLSYSYWNSPANFLLGAGVIYSIWDSDSRRQMENTPFHSGGVPLPLSCSSLRESCYRQLQLV